MGKFLNGYCNVVYHLYSFSKGNEPKKATKKVNSVKKQPQQNRKTLNFMGTIRALNDSHETSTSNHSKPAIVLYKYSDTNSIPTVLSVFQPIYHTNNLNQIIKSQIFLIDCIFQIFSEVRFFWIQTKLLIQRNTKLQSNEAKME